MSLPLPPEKLSEIQDALFRGEKIAAIKIHRECTRAGLKDSKEAVEFLEAELRKISPEKFSAAPSGKGCLGVLGIAAALGVVLGVLFFSR